MKYGVLLILMVSALLLAGGRVVDVYRGGFYDLPIFVNAALRHHRGEPVYQRSIDLAETYKPGAIVYKFPPVYLLPFLPWFDDAGVRLPGFSLGITLALLAFYAVLVICSIRLVIACAGATAAVSRAQMIALVVAVACCFSPFYRILGGTSVEGVMIAVAVLAFTVMGMYPRVAGAMLAWLAAVKLYPCFLLLYPLLTRQWRVLQGAVLGSVLLALLSLWIFGASENLFYVSKVLPVLLAEHASEDWTVTFQHATGNQGLVKVLASYQLLPNRLPFWVNSVRLPFVLATIFLVLKYVPRHDGRLWSSLFAYSMLIVTMLICLPNVFFAYFVMLLFPIVVLIGYAWFEHRRGLLVVMLLVTACFLVDDTWTFQLAQQAGFINAAGRFDDIDPALIEAVRAAGGAYSYMFLHAPLLYLLSVMGLATPFMPVVLWLLLAWSLCKVSAVRNGSPADESLGKKM